MNERQHESVCINRSNELATGNAGPEVLEQKCPVSSDRTSDSVRFIYDCFSVA
jgi:hypothetical protein